jgi:cell division protein FtsI (penicillin-binding protein 3)
VLLAAAFVLAYAVAGARMALVALGEPAEPRLAAPAAETAPVRGTITDRDGRLLAANLPAWSVFARPEEVDDPAGTARALAPILPGVDAATLERRLSAPRRFVWVRRPVTPRQRQRIMDLDPARPALKFGRRDMRVYPAGRTVAHIVGRVAAAEEGVRSATLVGKAGVELAFDARLRDPARADRPLALSIDLGAQQAMRDVLARGVERYGAEGAAGVMLDVRTGEVIAMVSLPDFDPNAPVDTTLRGADSPRFNQAVTGLYELGSVFKALTAAIAIDVGVATPETELDVLTPIRVRRNLFRERHDLPRYLSVTDIVARSSNLGSIRLALGVNTGRFREHLKALGLFEPTGLELGEAAARPLLPPEWTDLSTATISYGHGLSVSPMHLAAAYATLANGGRRVYPSLVKGGKPTGSRVFSERTATQMMQVLRATVTRGSARRAEVPGYEIGGKTGTAEKRKPNGEYDDERTRATFAAVFPTSEPRYAMVVMIDEPTDPESGSRQASRSAVPMTREAVARIAPIMGLPPRGGPVELAGDGPRALTAAWGAE